MKGFTDCDINEIQCNTKCGHSARMIQNSQDHMDQIKAYSPEQAEAADKGASENQSWICASIKLRLAEMK